MNNFYTTMCHVDQKDMNSDMIYGITAKKQYSGEVMFFDYHISFNLADVQRIADHCQKVQPTEDEFKNIIKSYLNL